MAWYWWVLLIYLAIGAVFLLIAQYSYGEAKPGAKAVVLFGWLPVVIWIIIQSVIESRKRPRP